MFVSLLLGQSNPVRYRKCIIWIHYKLITTMQQSNTQPHCNANLPCLWFMHWKVKTKSCHDANVVITDGTVGCLYDNLLCASVDMVPKTTCLTISFICPGLWAMGYVKLWFLMIKTTGSSSEPCISEYLVHPFVARSSHLRSCYFAWTHSLPKVS